MLQGRRRSSSRARRAMRRWSRSWWRPGPTSTSRALSETTPRTCPLQRGPHCSPNAQRVLVVQCRYGQTPLFIAACNGHVEVVAVLKKAGADLVRAPHFTRPSNLFPLVLLLSADASSCGGLMACSPGGRRCTTRASGGTRRWCASCSRRRRTPTRSVSVTASSICGVRACLRFPPRLLTHPLCYAPA